MINTTAGVLTATFLALEALDTDTFSLQWHLGEKGGPQRFDLRAGDRWRAQLHIADLFQGTAIGNGHNLGDFTSYAVLGSFAGAVFTPFTLGGTYHVILGFKEGGSTDDIVVGLRVATILEREIYACDGARRPIAPSGKSRCSNPGYRGVHRASLDRHFETTSARWRL